MLCHAKQNKIAKLPRQLKRTHSVSQYASAQILAGKSTISQTKLQTFSFNLCFVDVVVVAQRRFLKSSDYCCHWKPFFFLSFSGDMAYIRMWAHLYTATATDTHTHDYNFHTIETLIIMWTCRHTMKKMCIVYTHCLVFEHFCKFVCHLLHQIPHTWTCNHSARKFVCESSSNHQHTRAHTRKNNIQIKFYPNHETCTDITFIESASRST